MEVADRSVRSLAFDAADLAASHAALQAHFPDADVGELWHERPDGMAMIYADMQEAACGIDECRVREAVDPWLQQWLNRSLGSR